MSTPKKTELRTKPKSSSIRRMAGKKTKASTETRHRASVHRPPKGIPQDEWDAAVRRAAEAMLRAQSPEAVSAREAQKKRETERVRDAVQNAVKNLGLAIVLKPPSPQQAMALSNGEPIKSQVASEPALFDGDMELGVGAKAKVYLENILDAPHLNPDSRTQLSWADNSVDPSLSEHAIGAEMAWAGQAIRHGLPDAFHALLALSVPGSMGDEKTNILSIIGDTVSRAVRGAVALRVLEHCDWSLSRASETLGLGNTSNVIRSIKDLGLEAEYEEARGAGLISRGPRPKKKQSKET